MSGAVVGVAARARIGDGKVVEGQVVRSVPETTRKMVLILLAERVGADGRGAWPSLATLAAEAGLSRRTVQRAVASLLEDGFVERTRRRQATAVYDLCVDRLRAAGLRGAHEI